MALRNWDSLPVAINATPTIAEFMRSNVVLSRTTTSPSSYPDGKYYILSHDSYNEIYEGALTGNVSLIAYGNWIQAYTAALPSTTSAMYANFGIGTGSYRDRVTLFPWKTLSEYGSSLTGNYWIRNNRICEVQPTGTGNTYRVPYYSEMFDPISTEDLMSTYGNYICVGRIGGGTPSGMDSNFRQYEGNVPRTMSASTQHPIGRNYILAKRRPIVTDSPAEYDIMLPILSVLLGLPLYTSSPTNSVSTGLTYVAGTPNLYVSNQFAAGSAVKIVISAQSQTAEISTTGPNTTLILIRKDWFQKVMGLIRMPFTFNLDEAINAEIEDLKDYTPLDEGGLGDISEPDGGNGSHDDTSDAIDHPSLPNNGVLDTGLCTLYNPSTSQLKQLSTYLWTPDFLEALQKLISDPIEAIISLNMLPVNVPSGTISVVSVGNVSTGVPMPIVTSQYVTIDCGSLQVQEYWGNALDYSPYTTVQIYLPYIGIQALDIDDIMNGTLSVSYNIDVFTGACSATLKTTRGGLSSVLYNFTGNCGSPIPVTGRNFNQVLMQIANMAAGIGVGIATGGGAAMASTVLGSAASVATSKISVQKSGRIDTAMGNLAYPKPYLIISRPVQSLAGSYPATRGFPSNITRTLASVSGFTQVLDIHVTGRATDNEKKIIEQMLKDGVIL